MPCATEHGRSIYDVWFPALASLLTPSRSRLTFDTFRCRGGANFPPVSLAAAAGTQEGSTYGFNRLSRFTYDPSSATNTRNSEDVLVESSDKNYVYHSAGWLGFKPSAYENTNVSFPLLAAASAPAVGAGATLP